MQIVTLGDDLHEISKPIFLEKYDQSVVCGICPKSGKG